MTAPAWPPKARGYFAIGAERSVQGPQPRQSHALRPRVRGELHVYHRGDIPGPRGRGRYIQGSVAPPALQLGAACRSSFCPRGASWWASSFWTRRSTCRASAIPAGRPVLGPEKGRYPPNCSSAAISPSRSRRPFASMWPWLAPSSCTTAREASLRSPNVPSRKGGRRARGSVCAATNIAGDYAGRDRLLA